MIDNISSGASGILPVDAELHGRYRIVRVLGRGGMSSVYEAEHLSLGKRVAIKEMLLPMREGPEAEEAVRRFQNEARTLARLEHRYFPDVTDFFSENGRYYLVMEYVSGETLEDRVRAMPGFLSEEAVLRWAVQICDVLSYLHSQSPPVVFRDLKPSNIMVDESGRVKLIDFGIARIFKPGKQSDTQSMGTAGYSAPEQYGTGQTDARSDVYSLGACLHFLLTRRDPTASPFNFPPVRESNPRISANTERVVTRCLSMKPDDRYSSAAEVKKALLTSIDQPQTTYLARPQPPGAANRSAVPTPILSPKLPPATPAPLAPPSSSHQPWGLIALIVLAIMAAGAAGVYLVIQSRDNGGHQVPAVVHSTVPVPNIKGMDLDKAKQTLVGAKLQIDPQGAESNTDVPSGQVDRQDPASGASVLVGQAIKVWTSSGPGVVQVPDVKEMSVEQARTLLESTGLKVGQVTPQHSSKIPKDYVIRSQPRAKFQTTRGQAIDLLVSDGPPPAPEPPKTPGTEPGASVDQGWFAVTAPMPDQDHPHHLVVTVQEPDGRMAVAFDKNVQATADHYSCSVRAPKADSIKATVDDKSVTPDITPIPQIDHLPNMSGDHASADQQSASPTDGNKPGPVEGPGVDNNKNNVPGDTTNGPGANAGQKPG